MFAALLGSLHVAPATASGSFSLPFDSAASAGRGFAGLGADTEDPSALLVNPAASAWQTELRTVGGFHLAAYATRFRGEARRAATDDSRVDGGNGGKGGDIVFEAVQGLNTLIDFRYAQHFKAKRGNHGQGKDQTGAGAPDLLIEVPVGTQILSEDKEVPAILNALNAGLGSFEQKRVADF